MKTICVSILGCALALPLPACKKSQDSTSAATDLEKAFPPAAAAPVAPTAPQPTAPAGKTAVEEEIKDAVAAIRGKSYEQAFHTLRAVQAAPNITVDQYSAIENARLAVEREVAAKAAAGDPAAKKALQAIQKSH